MQFRHRNGVVLLAVLLAIAADAGTRGGRGGGGGRGAAAWSSTAQTRNVNRDVNRNVNRNVNIDGDRGYYAGGRSYGGDPVARAAAVTAGVALTAAAIGSVVYSLPAGCSPYYGYYACGGVYYQPQYHGDNVTYLVVNAREGAGQPAAEGSAVGSAQPIVQ